MAGYFISDVILVFIYIFVDFCYCTCIIIVATSMLGMAVGGRKEGSKKLARPGTKMVQNSKGIVPRNHMISAFGLTCTCVSDRGRVCADSACVLEIKVGWTEPLKYIF